ncbi:MAG: hypothetical protein J6T48_01110 [Bacteroidales bacterium]|nr:hypothetical protein [Bacteroidales bacterium]
MATTKKSATTKPKTQKTDNSPNLDRIKQIKSILDSLKQCDVYNNEEDGFSSDKTAIENVFNMTSKRTLSDILLRLTVIDSMYSTQMNRRYYALQELAEKLHCLDQIKPLPTLFKDFIGKKRDIHMFDGKIGTNKFNLFAEKYGIGKDGSDKGVAVSLISKYAYFETNHGFPIYDSIACEMYPRIWKYCGWKDKPPLLTVKDSSQQMVGDATIVKFVESIDELIKRLGGNISYDHLDRLLWFVGKIYRGNLSLVVDRKNYEWCTKNWKERDKDNNFLIDKVNIGNAPFCNNNQQLKAMFDLAKDLITK